LFDPAEEWQTATNVFGDSSTVQWHMPLSGTASNRFFRVMVEP